MFECTVCLQEWCNNDYKQLRLILSSVRHIWQWIVMKKDVWSPSISHRAHALYSSAKCYLTSRLPTNIHRPSRLLNFRFRMEDRMKEAWISNLPKKGLYLNLAALTFKSASLGITEDDVESTHMKSSCSFEKWWRFNNSRVHEPCQRHGMRTSLSSKKRECNYEERRAASPLTC